MLLAVCLAFLLTILDLYLKLGHLEPHVVELVMFVEHLAHGFTLTISKYFYGLIKHYKLRLHDIPPEIPSAPTVVQLGSIHRMSRVEPCDWSDDKS